ncbi:MAG TPA: serine protease [Flavipsychrobacter sp.]|nr:serine protease [Flavipsychrobacter sp.]
MFRLFLLTILLYFLILTSCKKKFTAEELNNTYAPAIVLIKHSYLYKIKLGSEEYYFKDYDKESGETSQLLSKDSAYKNPNVAWGTGFFIDPDGKILTCKHVVDIKPTAEDEKKILANLRKQYLGKQEELTSEKTKIEEEYSAINSYVSNYYSYLSYTDIAKYNLKKEELKERYDNINLLLSLIEIVQRERDNPDNYVAKTSLQFGIFLNGHSYDDLNDYIVCKSTKISTDDNVDLAVIETSDKKTPEKIKPVDFTRISQIEKEKISLNEKVYMIGFNDGIVIAQTTSGTTQSINSQLTEGKVSQSSDENKIMYTIPALPGSSGSPIFDEYGRIVAVNFAGRINSQSFNYGIQPMKIKTFLGK